MLLLNNEREIGTDRWCTKTNGNAIRWVGYEALPIYGNLSNMETGLLWIHRQCPLSMSENIDSAPCTHGGNSNSLH